MNKHSTRGFTLIELLVVIAIIGILASVVLASLGNARQRAQIAAVKQEITSQYALFVSECDANAIVQPANSTNVTWTGAAAVSCGPAGSGTWTATAESANATLCAGPAPLSASLNETGITWAPAGCI